MTALFSVTAFLSMFAAASVALAQQPSGVAGEPPAAASQAPAEIRSADEQARPHADADARACLEFVTNIGVIRCAEKYRAAHAVDTVRPGRRQSAKGSDG